MSEPGDPISPSTEARMLACAQDLNRLVLNLRIRYSSVVVIAALAENLGPALKTLIQEKALDANHAGQAIEHIAEITFVRPQHAR